MLVLILIFINCFFLDRINYFLVGATDDEVEGIWRWYTTGERLNDGYVNWAPGQPQDGSSTNQDCAALYGKSGYLMEDVTCEGRSHVICETP